MKVWEFYKKWFYAWEGATAQYLETWLKSPLVLEPAGAWLTAAMRAKAASDRAAASTWGALGLAFVVSALTAFVAVKWLLGYIRTHRFTPFAIYRIVFGLALLGLPD